MVITRNNGMGWCNDCGTRIHDDGSCMCDRCYICHEWLDSDEYHIVKADERYHMKCYLNREQEDDGADV